MDTYKTIFVKNNFGRIDRLFFKISRIVGIDPNRTYLHTRRIQPITLVAVITRFHSSRTESRTESILNIFFFLSFFYFFFFAEICILFLRYRTVSLRDYCWQCGWRRYAFNIRRSFPFASAQPSTGVHTIWYRIFRGIFTIPHEKYPCFRYYLKFYDRVRIFSGKLWNV